MPTGMHSNGCLGTEPRGLHGALTIIGCLVGVAR